MDTIRQTFYRFSKWIGWYDDDDVFQGGDNKPTAAAAGDLDETAADNDSSEDIVIGAFLDDDATADFVFNTDIENKRTCRYIAIHPSR